MAEGPQILLRARWLHQRTAGRTPLEIRSPRPELAHLEQDLQGRLIRRVSCRGKLLWFEFEGAKGEPLFLQNQLLMDGRWRRHAPDAELPDSTWLAFRFEEQTIANHSGQLFRLTTLDELQHRLAKLGPDVMAEPFPAEEIAAALSGARRSIAEDLLDQSVLCGIGNTAKSEALFLARLNPERRSADLRPAELEALAQALLRVTRDALTDRGRWQRRVYQRKAAPCPNCSTPIVHLRQGKPPRDTFACPRCQQLEPSATLYPARQSHAPRQGEFRLGCAIWAFPGWIGSLYPRGTNPKTFLQRYGERLTTVEGNVTFYTRPSTELLERWRDATPEGFQFVPKLPRDVTHNGELAPFLPYALEFLEHLRTLESRLGPIMAQLPGTYGPDRIDDLERFLEAWPTEAQPLLVELRHPAWFAAPHRERLKQLLAAHSAGRTHLDTRPIYDAEGDAQAGSQRRKPDVPLHPEDAVGQRSIVRFIANPDLEFNEPYLAEWADVVTRWLRAGRDVWFYAHCPREEQSPLVARRFQALLEERGARVPALPWNTFAPEPKQAELF